MTLTRYLKGVPKNFKIVGYFFMKLINKKSLIPSEINMAGNDTGMDLKMLSTLPRMMFSNRYINGIPGKYSIVGMGKHRVPLFSMKLSSNNSSLDFLKFMNSINTKLC